MGTVVVDVMLKSEILDPQGQAVAGALPRLGFDQFTSVRQGKHFVLTVDGEVTQEHLDAARRAAETLLSNPVMEDVLSVRVEAGNQADRDDAVDPVDPVDWKDDDDVDVALRGVGTRTRGATHAAVPPRHRLGRVDPAQDLHEGGIYDGDDD
jgi:phosphoribosylformylglycinamidine synthase subunit PurS